MRLFDYARYQPMLQQDAGNEASGNQDDPPNANGGGTEQPEQQTPENPPAISFPDEKSFMSRVDREARKRLDEEAKAKGFDSHKAMLAAIDAYNQQQEAEKTELERLQEQARTASEQRDAALRAANERLIRAEVKMIASDPDINIVPDAVNDAYLLMAKDDIDINDDGTVTGVKEALTALVEAKPWLRVTDTQPRAVPGSPRPAGQQSRQEHIAAITNDLRRSGQYGI